MKHVVERINSFLIAIKTFHYNLGVLTHYPNFPNYISLFNLNILLNKQARKTQLTL